MGLSPNFAAIRIDQDNDGREVLVVDGVTKENPGRFKAIYVALAHGKANIVPPPRGDAAGANSPLALQPEGEIKSAAPADAPDSKSWIATIAQPRTKVKRDDRVLVIGVAVPVSSRARPLFWHETLTVG
jgi:hypothetical protein